MCRKNISLASLETLFVSRFASHNVAPKLKRVFSSPFACEIWRSFLHLLGMFYFSHKLICFYKFDCSHRQVFPEVCALMEMLAVSCPHTCDVERANSLVKLFKDERSNRLTPQSLFHKLLMRCNGPDFRSFNESDLPKRIARFCYFIINEESILEFFSRQLLKNRKTGCKWIIFVMTSPS